MLIGGVALVLVGIAVAYFVLVAMSGRSDRESSDLLIDHPSSEPWVPRDADLPHASAFGTAAVAAKGWALPGIRMGLYAMEYQSPVSAEWAYLRYRPEWTLSDDFPSFDSVKPKLKDEEADSSRLVCALGELDSCQAWMYWARYGQYVVRLDYLSPSHPIDQEQFRDYARNVDAYVHSVVD